MRQPIESFTTLLLLAPAISVAHPAQAPAPTGIRSAEAKTAATASYKTSPADFASDNMVGVNLYNRQDEEIGEVECLLIDEGKRISGLVLSVGRFLGIGERYVAIAPESLIILCQAGGELRAIVNTRKEDLENGPEFEFAGDFTRD